MNEKLNQNGQFAVHETQRLQKICDWCQRKKSQINGYCKPCHRALYPLEKQNIRTFMQALHGCRKNCRECREEEQEWETDQDQSCQFHSRCLANCRYKKEVVGE